MKFVAVLIVLVAVLTAFVWHRKDELVLGSWWLRSFAALGVTSAYYLGVYSKINSTRILFDDRGMPPTKDALDNVVIEDIYVNHIAVRVYRPKSLMKREKVAAVIHMHGGEFIMGSIRAYDGFCYRLARSSEVAVFSIEYRRAPEHIFPTAINDCYETTLSLVNNAASYGIDPAKVVLIGDGAGGNLAAAVSQQVASLKQNCLQYAFRAQVLIYPMLQFLDFSLPSFDMDVAKSSSLTKENLALYWSLYINGTANFAEAFLAGNHSDHLTGTHYQSYLRSVEGLAPSRAPDAADIPAGVRSALVDPRACPLLADDLRQNPRTMIVTADYDILRDDGILYGVRLKRADVKVAHNSYPAPHGFLFDSHFGTYFGHSAAPQAFQDIVDYVKKACSHGTAS